MLCAPIHLQNLTEPAENSDADTYETMCRRFRQLTLEDQKAPDQRSVSGAPQSTILSQNLSLLSDLVWLYTRRQSQS